jgi:hypothetical protein
MGLKCSVLGHAYGETTVERDRQEQGSEVVITIREVETCDRCDTERVVSENKEVTSIETPDDGSVGDTDASDDGSPTATDADDASREEDAPAAGEELSASDIVSGESDENAGSDDSDDRDEEDVPGPTGSEPDTGAEILDAESAEPVDDEAVDEELADPTVDATDDGSNESDEPDDAVIIDEDDGDDDAPADRQPGEWPEEPNQNDDEWEPDTIGTIEEDEDEEQATESTTLTVPDGQFRCPECDFSTLVESSSLRRGDFCPECRRGTLVHEPEDETRKE